MDCKASNLSYKQTGYFSKLILDYLDRNTSLREFYSHPVSMDGLRAAMQERQKFNTDRKMLVTELKKQYTAVENVREVEANLEKLLLNNTFTITTAHQPAIFTGTLYFIYKILHVIKLADRLSNEFPQDHFVPIYFMGSEDADLDELGKIFFEGEKIVWDTRQTGAVGRMQTKGLDKIIKRIEGQFSVHPFGEELVGLLKDCYLSSTDVQTATFKLVHALFAKYGLIVLIPDNKAFKRAMLPVMEEDLFHQTSSKRVEKTIQELSLIYKVQANPREINLFYLKDDIRQRIERTDNGFVVVDAGIHFSDVEMKQEMQQHPERFSPNVILRGLMQETLLPNIAFVGGAGENAYWMELRYLFQHYQVPFPVIILRNSFLLIERKWKEIMQKLSLSATEIFQSEEDLLNALVRKSTRHQISLQKEIDAARTNYRDIQALVKQVDGTLAQHTEALETKAIKHLKELEKKILRAEKRRFEVQRKQIRSLRSALFPLNSLQERIENFIPYYAKWGKDFIEMIYKHSLTVEQEFVVLEEI